MIQPVRLHFFHWSNVRADRIISLITNSFLDNNNAIFALLSIVLLHG